MHEQLRELAEEDGVSINQFVAVAIAEKIATIKTIEYLKKRGRRGSREKLLAALEQVPDVEPAEYDRL
jgi:hypothetical protein